MSGASACGQPGTPPERLAPDIGLNPEHVAFGEGMAAMPGPASPQPDVLNAVRWTTPGAICDHVVRLD